MAQDIGVDKYTIKDLFGKCKDDGDFLIPEYQRPYAWDIEKIDALFDDVRNFMIESKDNDSHTFYFLGSIITYEQEHYQEIIDGQQRVTSLLLLLRALYTQLEQVKVHTEIGKKLLQDIEPLIWNNIGDIVREEYGKDKPHIKTEVILEEDSNIMYKILETGTADIKGRDHYSQNYLHFQERIDQDLKADELLYFCKYLIERVIVMRIKADNEETALTIFSTLNDRGEPLTDADIFKVQIYKSLPKKEQKNFIEDWKNLEKEAKKVGESIQHLFYYYMMFCRAKYGDVNTSTPRLREYFQLHKRKYYQPNADKDKLEEEIALLKDEKLLDNLVKILNFWKVVKGEDTEEQWANNRQIINILDCLIEYPNEYWKYPVIIFYFCHSDEGDFENRFLKFLRMLAVKLVINYLKTPTVTAIKSDVMNLSKLSYGSPQPIFKFDKVKNMQDGIDIICEPSKITRMLLKILAYCEQDVKLPNFEIEHIFPKKWDNNYVLAFSNEEVKYWIEQLGNKIPLEKKLNIKASNNYYDKKKLEYQKSKIIMAQKMGELNNWNLRNNISERNGQIKEQIKKLFTKWENDYSNE